jgi:hypothetical protein
MGKTTPTTPEYADHVARLRTQDVGLAEELSGFTGIEQVLKWMQRKGLVGTEVDIVGQDEFEYDFLLQLGSGATWLAFGVTRLGNLTAVAVWPHKPSADELLARRVKDGWEPATTSLKQRPTVLGHAACLLSRCQ